MERTKHPHRNSNPKFGRLAKGGLGLLAFFIHILVSLAHSTPVQAYVDIEPSSEPLAACDSFASHNLVIQGKADPRHEEHLLCNACEAESVSTGQARVESTQITPLNPMTSGGCLPMAAGEVYSSKNIKRVSRGPPLAG